MLKTFDLTTKEFEALKREIQYVDDFVRKYRKYMIPCLFEYAYLVKIKEKFYKISYFFDYGLKIFFNESVDEVSGEELYRIIEEYTVTLGKIKTIQEEKNYYQMMEKIKKENKSFSYYGVIKKERE